MPDGGKLNEKDPMHRLSIRYLKWTAYGLLLLAAAILQATPHAFTVLGARPLLLIPMVVCVAMFTGPVGGAAAGVAAGILWDLNSTRLLGFNALVLMAVGCGCGLFVHLLLRNNLLSAMLLFSGALLIQGLADWFFNTLLLGKEDPLFRLLHLQLPDMAFTLVVSPLVYGVTLLVARLLRRRE